MPIEPRFHDLDGSLERGDTIDKLIAFVRAKRPWIYRAQAQKCLDAFSLDPDGSRLASGIPRQYLMRPSASYFRGGARSHAAYPRSFEIALYLQPIDHDLLAKLRHRPQKLQLPHHPPRHEKNAGTDSDGYQHGEHGTNHRGFLSLLF
jgi:hypothetical protein